MRPDPGLLALACLGFLVFVFSPAQAARFSWRQTAAQTPQPTHDARTMFWPRCA